MTRRGFFGLLAAAVGLAAGVRPPRGSRVYIPRWSVAPPPITRMDVLFGFQAFTPELAVKVDGWAEEPLELQPGDTFTIEGGSGQWRVES
jgi:hypothetical protein